VLTGPADPFTWALRLVGVIATLGVLVLVGREEDIEKIR
jgi:hypothetical protein